MIIPIMVKFTTAPFVRGSRAHALWGMAFLWPFALGLAACEGNLGEGPPVLTSRSSGDEGVASASTGVSGVGGGEPAGSGGAGGADGAGGAGGAGAAGGAGGAPWQAVETDWCAADGWLGLDGHTCFYAPDTIAQPPVVLFFLHGMMPPGTSPAGMQKIARAAADTHGFVAVFPRGAQGLCAWDASVMEWWCWPTSRKTVDESAAGLIAGWTGAQKVLEGAIGIVFQRRYVLGFSNGGYFASFVGLEGLFATDGVGVVAAGRAFIDEMLMPPEGTPFYVAVGAMDQDSVKNSAQNLASVLDKHKWTNDFILHSDRGHEVRADDFDGAAVTWGWP